MKTNIPSSNYPPIKFGRIELPGVTRVSTSKIEACRNEFGVPDTVDLTRNNSIVSDSGGLFAAKYVLEFFLTAGGVNVLYEGPKRVRELARKKGLRQRIADPKTSDGMITVGLKEKRFLSSEDAQTYVASQNARSEEGDRRISQFRSGSLPKVALQRSEEGKLRMQFRPASLPKAVTLVTNDNALDLQVRNHLSGNASGDDQSPVSRSSLSSDSSTLNKPLIASSTSILSRRHYRPWNK